MTVTKGSSMSGSSSWRSWPQLKDARPGSMPTASRIMTHFWRRANWVRRIIRASFRGSREGVAGIEVEGALCLTMEGSGRAGACRARRGPSPRAGCAGGRVDLAHAIDDVDAGRRQRDELLPTIGGVLVALEVAVLDEPIDQPADGRRPTAVLREGGHADARVKGGEIQALGLRHRHVDRPGTRACASRRRGA